MISVFLCGMLFSNLKIIQSSIGKPWKNLCIHTKISNITLRNKKKITKCKHNNAINYDFWMSHKYAQHSNSPVASKKYSGLCPLSAYAHKARITNMFVSS